MIQTNQTIETWKQSIINPFVLCCCIYNDIDTMNINCNKCYDQTDLYISLSDVNIKYNGSSQFLSRHNITLEIHS